jgi:hypothetical protein
MPSSKAITECCACVDSESTAKRLFSERQSLVNSQRFRDLMDFSWSPSSFQFPQPAASDDEDDAYSRPSYEYNNWCTTKHLHQGTSTSVLHHHPTTIIGATASGNPCNRPSSPESCTSSLSSSAINNFTSVACSSKHTTGNSFPTGLFEKASYVCERFRNDCRQLQPSVHTEDSRSTGSGCYTYDVTGSGAPRLFSASNVFSRSMFDWNPTAGRHDFSQTGNRMSTFVDRSESRDGFNANNGNSIEFDSRSLLAPSFSYRQSSMDSKC